MSADAEVMEEASPVKVKVKGVYIANSQGNSPAPVVLLEDENADSPYLRGAV